jgi:hypothetical protein
MSGTVFNRREEPDALSVRQDAHPVGNEKMGITKHARDIHSYRS